MEKSDLALQRLLLLCAAAGWLTAAAPGQLTLVLNDVGLHMVCMLNRSHLPTLRHSHKLLAALGCLTIAHAVRDWALPGYLS